MTSVASSRRTKDRSGRRAMSRSRVGRASRMAIMGTSVCPPAMMWAPSSAASRAHASSMVDGLEYSNGAGFKRRGSRFQSWDQAERVVARYSLQVSRAEAELAETVGGLRDRYERKVAAEHDLRRRHQAGEGRQRRLVGGVGDLVVQELELIEEAVRHLVLERRKGGI